MFTGLKWKQLKDPVNSPPLPPTGDGTVVPSSYEPVCSYQYNVFANPPSFVPSPVSLTFMRSDERVVDDDHYTATLCFFVPYRK